MGGLAISLPISLDIYLAMKPVPVMALAELRQCTTNDQNKRSFIRVMNYGIVCTIATKEARLARIRVFSFSS